MNTDYHTAIVTEPGIIEFQERALPELGTKDVLIKVKAASICGSDLHVYKGKHPSAPLPVAVGHEVSGEVVRIGGNVSGVALSDRVAVEPVIACGKCHFCLRGKYHLCTKISFQYRQGQGGFAPYFVVNERWLHKLPEDISYEEGALIEPLAVAIHAVTKGCISIGQTGGSGGGTTHGADGPVASNQASFGGWTSKGYAGGNGNASDDESAGGGGGAGAAGARQRHDDDELLRQPQ